MGKQSKKVGIRIPTHAEQVSRLQKMVTNILIEEGYSDSLIADVMRVNRSSIFRVRKSLK